MILAETEAKAGAMAQASMLDAELKEALRKLELATAQVTGLETERDTSKALAANLETKARDEEAGKDEALQKGAQLAGQLEELRREEAHPGGPRDGDGEDDGGAGERKGVVEVAGKQQGEAAQSHADSDSLRHLVQKTHDAVAAREGGEAAIREREAVALRAELAKLTAAHQQEGGEAAMREREAVALRAELVKLTAEHQQEVLGIKAEQQGAKAGMEGMVGEREVLGIKAERLEAKAGMEGMVGEREGGARDKAAHQATIAELRAALHKAEDNIVRLCQDAEKMAGEHGGCGVKIEALEKAEATRDMAAEHGGCGVQIASVTLLLREALEK
ncbi:hypothetical protein T484DRAFT_1840670, partial [Baffinella frigidus]